MGFKQLPMPGLDDPKVRKAIKRLLTRQGIRGREQKCLRLTLVHPEDEELYLFWSGDNVKDPVPLGSDWSSKQWCSLDGNVQVATVSFSIERMMIHVDSLSRNRNNVFHERFWAGVAWVDEKGVAHPLAFIQ